MTNLEIISGERYERLKRFGWKTALEAGSSVPRSVSAQGAMMARRCQEAGEKDPVAVGQIMLSDRELLAKLIKAAHAAHRSRGVDPNIPLETLAERAEQVTMQGFKSAGALITLDPQTLERIYKEIYHQVGPSKQDLAMMTAVKRLTGIDLLQVA